MFRGIWLYFLNQSSIMFLQLPQSYLQRQTKTSEPRFRKLDRLPSSQSKPNTHAQLKTTKATALDNSKQNLFYEGHLTKVRSACKLDETAIVSRYLGTIRKDYDDMNKMSRREVASMKLKRREIQFMKRRNNVYCQMQDELEAKIGDKEKQTSDVRAKEQDTKMQAKTLENIIVRMKRDQIFYKQFGRIRDEELKTKMKEVKLLQERLIQEEEKLHKLANNLQKCKDLSTKNQEAREKKFQDFSGKISDVRERDRFLQQRKERTYQLQSIELNDTLDDKNIHMREITLAHKVADIMLESKVTTLIKTYSEIQGAFHLVKIKTGVSQPQLLTSKFFSYEQTSESLLGSISENERYIEELREKKQMLTDKYRQINNERLQFDDAQVCWMPRHQQVTRREELIKDINKNQLLVTEIKSWITQISHDLKPQASSKKIALEDKFRELNQLLTKQLKENENYNWAERRVSTMGVCLKKMMREKSAEELSIRLRESLDMNQSNLIEEEFIKSSRHVIQKKAFTIKQVKRDSKQ